MTVAAKGATLLTPKRIHYDRPQIDLILRRARRVPIAHARWNAPKRPSRRIEVVHSAAESVMTFLRIAIPL